MDKPAVYSPTTTGWSAVDKNPRATKFCTRNLSRLSSKEAKCIGSLCVPLLLHHHVPSKLKIAPASTLSSPAILLQTGSPMDTTCVLQLRPTLVKLEPRPNFPRALSHLCSSHELELPREVSARLHATHIHTSERRRRGERLGKGIGSDLVQTLADESALFPGPSQLAEDFSKHGRTLWMGGFLGVMPLSWWVRVRGLAGKEKEIAPSELRIFSMQLDLVRIFYIFARCKKETKKKKSASPFLRASFAFYI